MCLLCMEGCLPPFFKLLCAVCVCVYACLDRSSSLFIYHVYE